MQSNDKDSLSKLIEDVDKAAVCDACTYFGRQGVYRCNGCPAYMDDYPCTKSVLEDVARRMHALMPHDADGREIKAGDTVKNLHGQFKDIEVMEIRPVPFGDELANARSLNMPVTYPANWHVIEPDSWEKLQEDAAKPVCEYAGAQKSVADADKYSCINCPYDEPGPHTDKGCHERMRLDLVRRAKRLAGVEQ
mgnify:CR=1 FL=1